MSVKLNAIDELLVMLKEPFWKMVFEEPGSKYRELARQIL